MRELKIRSLWREIHFMHVDYIEVWLYYFIKISNLNIYVFSVQISIHMQLLLKFIRRTLFKFGIILTIDSNTCMDHQYVLDEYSWIGQIVIMKSISRTLHRFHSKKSMYSLYWSGYLVSMWVKVQILGINDCHFQ